MRKVQWEKGKRKELKGVGKRKRRIEGKRGRERERGGGQI